MSGPVFPGIDLYPGGDLFPGFDLYPGDTTSGGLPQQAPGQPETFRVFAYDINTNTEICELSALGLTFDSRLNDAGSIGFDLDLLDRDAAAQAAPFLQYYANGVPVALYVERDGVLVWGGYQTTANYQHTAHLLPVQGKEWLAYFGQRLIGAPYDQPTYPNGLDPALLLSKAVTDCQNPALCGPGANLGISVVGGTSDLPWQVPSYTLRQTFVSQVIADVVAGITPGTGGVDVWTQVAWDANGGPSVTIHIESPRAGRSAAASGLAFDLLAAVDFTYPTDYMQACTTLNVSGAGSGQVAPSATVQAPIPVGGLGQMPRMDKVISHSNVTSPKWLATLAQGDIDLYGGPLVTPTVTVPTGDATNPLGTWIVGDDARLTAEAFELVPAGIDDYWRIVQHAVTVPDDGVPTVTLTFNPPPNY